MELENGRLDTVVVVFVFGGGFFAGVEALLRALKGLLELRALIPGVVATDVEMDSAERDGVAMADDVVSSAVRSGETLQECNRSRRMGSKGIR